MGASRGQRCLSYVVDKNRVFGLGLHDRRDELFTTKPNIVNINTAQDALLVQPALGNESHMVIFLTQDFSYGLDLKFQAAAKVIVALEEEPEVETLMQMLGRGARNMNTDLGTVIIQADPGVAEGLKNKWKTHKGVDFKEGAKVLRMALAMHKAGLKANGKEWLHRHTDDEWRVTKQAYYRTAPSGIQSLIHKF